MVMVKTGFDAGRSGRRDASRRVSGALAPVLRVAFAALMLPAATATFYAGLPMAAAIAKDGGSGGGGSDHDRGDHSGSGGSDHSGGDDGGKGRGGDDDGGEDRGDDGGRGRGEDSGKGHGRSVGRYLDSLKSRGRVVWSSSANGVLEVRYADGWSERVKGSIYSLVDPARRNVVSRPARTSDTARLRAAMP
ncbi:hypothetical protein [Mesorhizobium sp. CN2-181]|uniref:hypothetical protein n=1 Tax=Mesorhizobium yinganensis TaxID=3157707 RepID=UPI0032B859C2